MNNWFFEKHCETLYVFDSFYDVYDPDLIFVLPISVIKRYKKNQWTKYPKIYVEVVSIDQKTWHIHAKDSEGNSYYTNLHHKTGGKSHNDVKVGTILKLYSRPNCNHYNFRIKGC